MQKSMYLILAIAAMIACTAGQSCYCGVYPAGSPTGAGYGYSSSTVGTYIFGGFGSTCTYASTHGGCAGNCAAGSTYSACVSCCTCCCGATGNSPTNVAGTCPPPSTTSTTTTTTTTTTPTTTTTTTTTTTKAPCG